MVSGNFTESHRRNRKLRTSRVILTIILSGAVVAALAAENMGQSELTLSDGVEGQFPGEALHMIQELETGNRWILALYHYESDADLTALSLVFSGDNPGPGTYEISEGVDETDFHAAIMQMEHGITSIGGPASGEFLTDDGGIDVNADDTAGELVIDSVDGDTVAGSVRFRGEMVKMTDRENVIEFTLEATFTAVAGEAGDLPGMLGGSAAEE
jgi:hypothetical protein